MTIAMHGLVIFTTMFITGSNPTVERQDEY